MQHFEEADLARLGRAGAVEAMRGFLRDTAAGRTAAPPRLRVPIDERTLVFTVGGSAGSDLAGFRLYSIGKGRAPESRPDQLLALMRISTGEILATAVGADFGAWRTAALGAVGMHVGTAHIGRPIRATILGAGFQAFHHARTWAATRPIASFTIWARRPEAAAKFASALETDTGVPSSLREAANDAVSKADAILGVTRSETPVFDAAAMPTDLYIATVGPKFGGQHELPSEAYASADVLISDAPAQCATFEGTAGPLPGGRLAAEMLDLADLLVGKAELPTSGRRLFVSEGLAGSEVALLGALAAEFAPESS